MENLDTNKKTELTTREKIAANATELINSLVSIDGHFITSAVMEINVSAPCGSYCIQVKKLSF